MALVPDPADPGWVFDPARRSRTMSTVRYVAKALVAAFLAGLAAAITGLDDGVLDTVEWLIIVSAFIAAGGAVFGVTNGPHPGGGPDV